MEANQYVEALHMSMEHSEDKKKTNSQVGVLSGRKVSIGLAYLPSNCLAAVMIFLSYKTMGILAQASCLLERNIFNKYPVRAVLQPPPNYYPLLSLVVKQQSQRHHSPTHPLTYLECKKLIDAHKLCNQAPSFPYFRYLVLDAPASFAVINDAILKDIIDCFPHLITLSISSKHVTDAGLECLKTLAHLKVLNLMGCSEIGDAGLLHLSGLTDLEELNLTGCKKITDRGVRALSPLHQLRRLSLVFCLNITGEGLLPLSELTLLEALDLTWCQEMTDDGMGHLRQATRMKHLALSFCRKVTDRGVAHLKDHLLLERLDLTWCKKITDRGLLELKTPMLTYLNVSGCRLVTERGRSILQKT